MLQSNARTKPKLTNLKRNPSADIYVLYFRRGFILCHQNPKYTFLVHWALILEAFLIFVNIKDVSALGVNFVIRRH